MNTLTIHALMVAAGKGARFGADRPKQYLQINDLPVLVHSALAVNEPRISDLTFVLAADDVYADQAVRQIADRCNKPIFRTLGGDERWQSVQAGLMSLKARGVADNAWVLIHDAARPCLPMADLSRLIDAIEQIDQGRDAADALILASPVVDTLKRAHDGKILETVSRDGLWQALTPQVFHLGGLISVLDHVATHKLVITDEASAYESLGKMVKIIPASKMNIKLTYPDDLPLLTMILAHQAQHG